MFYSPLAKDLLAKAEEIHTECGAEHMSALCFVVAAGEYCLKTYEGITPYDNTTAVRYEAERLRYAWNKAFRHPSMAICKVYRHRLAGEYAAFNTDFRTEAEMVAEGLFEKKNQALLTADVLFVIAVNRLQDNGLLVRREAVPDIPGFLRDIEEHIYDFVIDELEKIRTTLKTKIDEAIAIRDWRPAAKFTEPALLRQAIFESTGCNATDKEVDFTIPAFFDEKDGDLHLTIIRAEDVYFVQDHGCTIRQLRKRAGADADRLIAKLCDPSRVRNDILSDSFCQVFYLFTFLKDLVMLAHADLIGDHIDTDYLPIFGKSEWDKYFTATPEAFSAEELLEEIKDSLRIGYDENTGLYAVVGITYAGFSLCAAYAIQTLENDRLCFRDNRVGKYEGEIFESLYWGRDDVSMYADFIRSICAPFGADYDGREVSLTVEGQTPEACMRGFFRFFRLSVLLSELAHLIELPEVSE